MEIRISSTLLACIDEHARADPCREICGLLLGKGGQVTTVVACRNVAEDATTAFEIDPAALLAHHRAARRGGPEVLGHYHSHPSGEARPSLRDAAAAAPDGSLWLIVAGPCISGWRAVERGLVHGRFVPVRLVPHVACAVPVPSPQEPANGSAEKA